MLFNKLRKQENFSEAEKSLASLLLNYGEELAYVSIQDLATTTYTSTTTIQRLCRKVGCSGFKDFKVHFLKELTEGKNIDSMIDVNRPFHFGAQASLIAANLEKVYTLAIETTMQSLNFEKINQAVDILRKADTILVYGVGDSGITARAFCNRMLKVKKLCILATDNGEQVVYSLLADQKAAAIFISYRGGTTSLLRCGRLLKKHHVPYIVLSSDVDTDLSDEADIHLTIPSYEVASDNIATFYSQECFSFILNLIYSLMYARSYNENLEQKKEVDIVTSAIE